MTLPEAADRYRAAADAYHQAAAHAIATRRDGWTRDAHKANAAARDARKGHSGTDRCPACREGT